ncbi:MAG: hypothetical protein ABSA50_12445 [Candidatus Bathyarchaeia archaeon]|jgi:hypothetical protein
MFRMKSISLLLLLLVIIASTSLIPTLRVNAQTGDFQITADPSHVSIGTDGTAHFVVKITSVNGFSGPLQLAVTGIAQNIQSQYYATFQPSTLQLAPNAVVYSMLTLTISYQYVTLSANTIGTSNFAVTATANGIVHSAPLAVDIFYGSQSTVQLSDVSLSLAPNIIQTTASITQSQSATLQLSLSSGATTMTGQTLLAATLQAYDVPSGLMITFTPNTVNIVSGQTATVTLSVLMTPSFLQTGGTYIFAIGINALMQSPLLSSYSSYQNYFISKVTTLTIIIPPAFNIEASPTIMDVLVGGPSQQLGIVVTPITSGLTDPIVLSVQGLPAGILATFQTNPLTPNGLQPITTNLVVQAPPSTFPVTTTVTISATAAGITNTVTVIFTLLPTGDYSVQADQTLLSFTGSGQSKTVTLTITPQNGFRSNINLTALNLPVGFSATFSPQSLQIQQSGPITVTLTIVAGSNIQPGTYSVSIVSNTGVTASKTTVLTVLVRAGVGQIWPIVLVVVVIIAVVSLIAFIGLPRGREVRRIPERPSDVPSLPP